MFKNLDVTISILTAGDINPALSEPVTKSAELAGYSIKISHSWRQNKIGIVRDLLGKYGI